MPPSFVGAVSIHTSALAYLNYFVCERDPSVTLKSVKKCNLSLIIWCLYNVKAATKTRESEISPTG
jgi:hypothetical protein